MGVGIARPNPPLNIHNPITINNMPNNKPNNYNNGLNANNVNVIGNPNFKSNKQNAITISCKPVGTTPTPQGLIGVPSSSSNDGTFLNSSKAFSKVDVDLFLKCKIVVKMARK